MLVLVGIPSGDMVHAEFAMCLSNMMVRTASEPGYMVALFNAKGCNIDRNHYYMAKKAVELGADRLLIIGTDMTFPAETLVSLAEAGKDVIACNAAKRTPPHKGVAFDDDGKPLSMKKGREIVEVGHIGSGIMMIDTKVFGVIPEPWFRSAYIGDGNFDSCDYNFCRFVKAAGFGLYCHRRLSKMVGHIGTTTHML